MVTATTGTGTTPTGQANQATPASYINLPPPGHRQAPKKFKGHHRELDRFLDHYKHVCTQYNVTESAQKCLGLLLYCSDEVAETIENLESYIKRDFTDLVNTLRWLYDSDRKKAEYHTGNLEEFTTEWRQINIQNLETLKKYQRKFYRIAGALKTAGHLEEREFNRWFWAGLHYDTRVRLERQMTNDDPNLDLTVPFEVAKVVKAAKHIFSRERFDKFLLEQPERKATTKNSKKSKKSHRHKKEETSDESSEDSSSEEDTDIEEEKPTRRRTTRSAIETPKVSAPEMPAVSKKRAEIDEITQLVKGMEGLSIHENKYRTYFTRLYLLSPETCKWYPEPSVPPARTFLTQGPRFETNNRVRDPPPHQAPPRINQGFGERRETTCYGCNERGHRMDQCAKIEALIQQGHVKRVQGRLRWPDDTGIIREPDESWADAIGRRVQHEKSAKDDGGVQKSVYYVEVGREDSDADTETQEELGWRSGTSSVRHFKSYGVERSPRVSRDTRKNVQYNSPPRSHHMKDLPARRHFDPLNRERGTITKHSNLHQSQDRLKDSTTPTAIDVAPGKFEGKVDDEFVPMDVEQPVANKTIDHGREPSTRNLEGNVRNVGQARTVKGKAQQGVIEDLLDSQVTIKMRDLVSLSSSVRQGLATTLRSIRDDAIDEPEMTLKPEKPASKKEERAKVMRVSEPANEWVDKRSEGGPTLRKADVPMLKVMIGEAGVWGIVDSGSQANIISAKVAEATGQPVLPLKGKSFSVTGVDGVPVRCKAWIPRARVFVTSAQVETIADLHVVEGIDCDLLLGRPWAIDHQVGIQERPRGTYVSWKVDDTWYDLNVTLARAVELKRARRRKAIAARKRYQVDSEEERSYLSVYPVRVRDQGTDRSYVPDSEASRVAPEAPEDGECQEESVGEQERNDAVAWARQKVTEWKRKWEEEGALDGDDEGEVDDKPGDVISLSDGDEESPPPNQLGQKKSVKKPNPGVEEEVVEGKDGQVESRKRKRSTHTRTNVVEVDKDLEEEFAKLVQEEADEEEWDAFCVREGQRLASRNQKWLEWIEMSDEEDAVNEEAPLKPSKPTELLNTSVDFDDRESRPLEPSLTLKTHPEKSTKRVRAKKIVDPEPGTREVLARRTQRVRHLTERGRYGEEEKRRRYQRREKAMRVVTQRPQPAVEEEPESGEEPQIFSYCLRVVEYDEEAAIRAPEPGPRRIVQPPRPPTPWWKRKGPWNKESSVSTFELDDKTGVIPGQWRTDDEPKTSKKEPRLRPKPPTIRIPTSQEAAGMSRDPLADIIIELDDTDSSDLSIVNPVRNMISNTRETRTDEATYGSSPRATRPRPDSEVYPNRHEFWKSETQDKGKRRAHDTHTAPEEVMPHGTKVDRWMRRNEEEDEWGGKHDQARKNEGGSRPNRDREPRGKTREVSEDLILDLTRFVDNSPTEIEGSYLSDGPPVIPKRVVRRKPRRMDLRTERRRQELESSKTMTTPEREKSGSAIRIARHAVPTSQLRRRDELRRRVGRPRKLVANLKGTLNSPEGPTCDMRQDIRTGQFAREETHLPPWLQKFHQLRKPLTALSKLELLLLALVISALANYLRLSRLQMTHLTTTSPRQALGSEGRSSRGTPSLENADNRPIDKHDQDISTDQANTNDIPKAVMDALYAPSSKDLTPGIIAMSHVVPLVVESSHPTREYLGKGATVSFRLGSGRAVQYRADVHLRIYDRGTARGWKHVDLPSRKDVDLLRGILFREPGYEDVMGRIREEARRVPPFSGNSVGGEVVRTHYERNGVSPDMEEELVGKNPPNTPVHTKVGPPGARKPGMPCRDPDVTWEADLCVAAKAGQRARRSKPFGSQQAYDDHSSEKAEVDQKMKIEDDDEAY